MKAKIVTSYKLQVAGGKWQTVCFFLLFTLSSFLFPLSSLADTNTTWEFTNAANYTLSDSSLIGVDTNAPGYAELILQAQSIYRTTFADYEKRTSMSKLGLGSPAIVRLTGTPGAYSVSGKLISQVFDSGVGNDWHFFNVKSSDDRFGNNINEVPSSYTSLIGLWRINNNLNDSSGFGRDGVWSYLPIEFRTDAVFGSHSGYFNAGNYINCAAPGGFSITNQFTVSFWVSASNVNQDAEHYVVGIGNGSSPVWGVRVGGTYDAPADIKHSAILLSAWPAGRVSACSAEGLWTVAEDEGVWRHIVVTYDDNSVPRTRIYKDGKLLQMFSDNVSGSLSVNDFFRIGARPASTFLYPWKGGIDEVALLNRALSPREVKSLYTRNYPVHYQLRSGNSATLTGDFLGPDGTTNSIFTGSSELVSVGAFDITNRFIQYQAMLYTDVYLRFTPYIESIKLLGDNVQVADNTVYDFLQSELTNNVVIKPNPENESHLGIAKNENGGYYTNGVYTSRVLGTNSPANWGTISWVLGGNELGFDIYGLVGLFHMESDWNSDVGFWTSLPSGTPGHTDYAKLGLYSGLFDGNNSSISLSRNENVQSVEFWLKTESPNNGIMEVMTSDTNSIYISLSNDAITVTGTTNTPAEVYVNGSPISPRIINGWNHVAVVFDDLLSVANVNIGVANGDYMAGCMDELALYDRDICDAEISSHYAGGVRNVAGKIVKAEVRAGDSLPLTDSFAGSFDNNDSVNINGTNYLQYRLYLAGDGDGTPAIESISMVSDLETFVDDTHAEIVQGTHESDATVWYGDLISLLDMTGPDPLNLDGALAPSGLQSIWHMDEVSWLGGGPVVKDSKGVQHGSASPDTDTVPDARVGSRCGYFAGMTNYVVCGSITLDNDFTVSLWFNTSDTNRSALISTDDGSGYYTIEINGDGSGSDVPGRLAFIVNDTVTTQSVVALNGNFNDGQWHNVMGVRSVGQIHIYVDGDRMGTANLGTGFGGVGGGSIYIAKYGTQSIYYEGYIDETAIWNKALTEAEIGYVSAGGWRSFETGIYISETLDALQPATWQTLSWVTDGPYSKPLSTTDSSLLALLRMEAIGGGNIIDDETGGSHDGTAVGGPSISAAGRLDNCLSLDGSSQYVRVNDPGDLGPASLTVEAWVNMDAVTNKIIFDKSGGGNGYTLGTDGSGKPYFWIGGVGATITGYLPVRIGKWTHIAGVYDNDTGRLRLYVDGDIAAVSASGLGGVLGSAGQAVIGCDSSESSGYLDGLIDEVALHDRALGNEEILDHYRAGVVTLKFQCRVSDDTNFPGVNFTGPGQSNTTYFTESSGEDMIGDLPLGRYSQYKVYFASEDYKLSPKLSGINMYAASFPNSNPYVEPSEANGFLFDGRLLGFEHSVSNDVGDTGKTSKVEYQISGDGGTNWYHWNGVQWTLCVLAFDTAYGIETSTKGEIQTNIVSFFDQLYPKTGGNFLFRLFEHSDGAFQMACDKVDLTASKGRIIVTSPNGGEEWVSGTRYDVTWSSTGIVSSSNLVIDLYDQSGSNFRTNLATNVLDTGVANVLISTTLGTGTTFRVNIWDDQDDSIHDMSDADFLIDIDFHLRQPDGGEHWYLGDTNTVLWDAPPGGSPVIALWFSYDGDICEDHTTEGSNSWTRVIGGISSSNANMLYDWHSWLTPKSNNWRLVSEKARMAVTASALSSPLRGSSPRDFSDTNFMMAGIAVMDPFLNKGVNNGNAIDIKWAAAGAGTNVIVDFYNGVTWANLSSNVFCQPGTNNIFNAVVAGETTNALIKITSESDPGKVWGVSDPFTIADISIVAPVGGVPANHSHWVIGETNNIRWTASGAGTNVSIMYAVSNAWVVLESDYYNDNSDNFTNEYPWVIPGPPSGTVTVRVEAVGQTDLNDEAGPFSMSGIEVLTPAIGSTWQLTNTHDITWISHDGNDVDVSISFDGGVSYETVTNGVYSEDGVYGVSGLAADLIRRPSDTARIKLTQINKWPPNLPFSGTMQNNFTVRGIKMIYPTNGLVNNLGDSATNGLKWYSARTRDNFVEFAYSADNGPFDSVIMHESGLTDQFSNKDSNLDDGTCSNKANWKISRQLKPSDNARVRVSAVDNTVVPAETIQSITEPFILRGVRIVAPAAGANIDLGSTYVVQWDYAAVAGAAQMSNDVSINGGPFIPAGFTNNGEVQLEEVSWTVDPDLDPTTNAVIRMRVYQPAQDTDVLALSEPFTLRGIKIISPAQGVNWTNGFTETISFIAAGLNPGDTATLYYSPDGVDFDMSHPIVSGLAVSNGIINNFSWNIENSTNLTRMPSTNGYVRIVSGSVSNTSKAFTLNGIKVIRPNSDDVWAVSDLTNTIEWASVGILGNYDLSFTVYSGTNPPYPYTNQIILGTPGTNYDWTMTNSSIGDQVTVTVTGGGLTNESEVFEIVPAPSIRIRNPIDGAYWKATETNMIEWKPGGIMVNDFSVLITYADSTQIELANGSFPTNVAGNLYFDWGPIPFDKPLGPAVIAVTNRNNPSIWDQVTNFNIAAKFDITPFSTPVYALKPDYLIEFTAWGSVTNGADFFYSIDPNAGTNNWVLINTNGPITVMNGVPLSYDWDVPDAWESNCWIRMQDHSYVDHRFSTNMPGPYNDYGTFPINYYRVMWQVFDSENSNHLDHVSIVDSSGLSASDLTSPITLYYPYGTWNTVWYREFFHDQAVLGWDSATAGTNDVWMTRSQIEPDYHVLANFAFDVSNRSFTVHSWLERSGRILENPAQSTIDIYDDTGTLVESLVNNTYDVNGVFWEVWDVGNTETNLGLPVGTWDSTDVFFAKVSIEFAGVDYSAGLTFQLRMAAADETVAAIQAAITASQTAVTQAIAGVDGKVDIATNMLGIVSDAITNDLLPNMSAVTNAMTNVIDIIGPMSNMPANVSSIWDKVDAFVSASILPGPTVVSFGSTNMILYRTRSGYAAPAPTITVSNAAQGVVAGPLDMTEIISGIYERNLVADWGTNAYTVICSDPGGESDSMILKVVHEGFYEVPDTLAAFVTQLNTIESQVTNISYIVQSFGNVSNTLDSIITDIASVSNTLNTVPWNDIAAVTNITAIIPDLTNAAASLDMTPVLDGITGVQTDLSGVKTDVSDIKNDMGDVKTTVAGVDLSALDRMEDSLGTISDNASANTFFGQLADMEDQISSAGSSAADAVKKAQTAKTEASSAASGIQTLKAELGSGNVDKSLAILEDVRRSMIMARESLKEIPRVVEFASLQEEMILTMKRIKDLADSEAYKGWVEPEIKELGEETGEEDKISILTENIGEVKESLGFMSGLVDEMRFKPFVKESLLAVE
ncbi:LamG-like jellyroll fold domain-containing protein [Verrucomicrobiota bacterium]